MVKERILDLERFLSGHVPGTTWALLSPQCLVLQAPSSLQACWHLVTFSLQTCYYIPHFLRFFSSKMGCRDPSFLPSSPPPKTKPIKPKKPHQHMGFFLLYGLHCSEEMQVGCQNTQCKDIANVPESQKVTVIAPDLHAVPAFLS